MMRRRTCGLGLLIILAAIATTRQPTAIGADDQRPHRPNLVFVYTDDQRWDAMGVVQREQGDKARFPWLRTPNMDRLAAEGVRFRNAFVVNSLCAPSRATFLTGVYGYNNGIVNNHTPFPIDNVTHATLLKQTGYVTGYVGKFHMGSQRGQRPGFDFSASFVGQGRYFDCPIEVNGVETPSQGWVDDVSTDYATKFLRDNRDKPFVLVVGFKATHGPCEPPDRSKGLYANELARTVPNLNQPAIYARGPKEKPAEPTAPGTVPVNLNYFRCISAADDNLGRILKTLDDLKLTDDTMVVFASDNGYYLGEHRLGDKRSAYDESLRIPLIVRYPKLASKGQTVDRMALNIDLAPTFLDYAGVTVPASMQGRSWKPLLEGHANDWRKAFFYCYFYEQGFRVPMVTAVRTDTAKLIRYPGHDEWTELFDLTADPYELRNLISDPVHTDLRKQLEAEYEHQKSLVGFHVPDYADDPKADEPRVARNAWVLDDRFDQDEGARVIDSSGLKNHGQAVRAPLVDGRDGHKARRFDGQGHIAIAKSPSLDPAVKAWAVEVSCKPDRDTGIVFAHGGQTQGYALHLVDGRPAFTVAIQNRRTRVVGREPIVGKWVTLRGQIRADEAIQLFVDGQKVAEKRLDGSLHTPNDTLQIGADLGSPVLGEDTERPNFVGLIDSVRIYSGVAP